MKSDLEFRNWVSNPSVQQELTAILSNPVFKRAVELAKDLNGRSVSYEDGPILERNALAHAEAVGADNLINTLSTLASPPKEWATKASKPLPEPFSYLKEDQEKHTVI